MEEALRAQLPEGSLLASVYDEIRGYTSMIAEQALYAAMVNPQIREVSFRGFMSGLQHYPSWIPYKDGTMADYPWVADILASGLDIQRFERWLTASDPLTYPDVMEQIIARSMHHLVTGVLARGADISPSDVALMRTEFSELNFKSNTTWLSRIFNGMQTTLFEVYVIDTMLEQWDR